jgi:hypothetical protein
MKKHVLLVAAILFSFGMVAPVLAEPGDFHGDFGYTYDSMHVWRGFMTWGQHSGSNLFVDLDFFGSGFGMGIVDHMANGTGNNGPLGYSDEQRTDYALFYQNKIAGGDALETDYKISYVYYNYPDMSARHSDKCIDLQEINTLLAWPNITGIKGLVPAYCIVKLWPSMHDTVVGENNPSGGTASGWAHIFMLNYALPLENISSEIPKQTLDFHTELVWNDGIDPRPFGGYKSSDWSDFVMGLSTDFDLGSGFIFTPGINEQITMEDNGNRGVSPKHDITWATLTIKYKW